MAPDRPLADKMTKVSADRRVAKTRESLITAFRDLVLERGYARVSALAIIERANVGRSTFYEHFENKDDLFRASLAAPLSLLASAVLPGADLRGIAAIVEHFAENRRFALTILNGPTRTLATHTLAEQIEALLPKSNATTVAALAGAQIEMVCAWLVATKPGSAKALAASLRDASRALVVTLA